MNNNHLQAVHDDDLIELLVSLEIYDKVVAGKCECLFCKKIISLDNLGAIMPHNGQIEISCSEPSCMFFLAKDGVK